MSAHLRAINAAIEGLAVHGESCGHIRHDSDCGYCDDKRIAVAARKALQAIRTEATRASKPTGAES